MILRFCRIFEPRPHGLSLFLDVSPSECNNFELRVSRRFLSSFIGSKRPLSFTPRKPLLAFLPTCKIFSCVT